jgi:hypothetical protein
MSIRKKAITARDEGPSTAENSSKMAQKCTAVPDGYEWLLGFDQWTNKDYSVCKLPSAIAARHSQDGRPKKKTPGASPGFFSLGSLLRRRGCLWWHRRSSRRRSLLLLL